MRHFGEIDFSGKSEVVDDSARCHKRYTKQIVIFIESKKKNVVRGNVM